MRQKRNTLAFLLVLIADLSIGQPQRVPPRTVPKAPYTSQDIVLPFAGLSAQKRLLLTLNNNRPDNLKAELTLYDLDGQEIPLPPMTLVAAESRLVELSQTLRDSGINASLGYLKINYSGRLMELGAQLTLYPTLTGGGLDSPRTLASDYKSAERAAVAWLPPHSNAVLSFVNVTDSPVTVEASLNGKPLNLLLAPHHTKIAEQSSDDPLLTPSSVELTSSASGANDSVRVFGYVKSSDGPLPIRVYDPHGSTSLTLSAVGMSTDRETHMFVHNIGAVPVVIKPSFHEVGPKVPKTASLDEIILGPYATKELNVDTALRRLGSQGVARATVLIAYNGQLGSLVASLTQKTDIGVFEDIPLRTPNPRSFMRGAYPLRWSDDYTNRPMVANTSTSDLSVRAYVISGGATYFFPSEVVKAGATRDYDVDLLRREQTPDAKGTKIPLTATYGKFHWMPGDLKEGGGLRGRTELLSINQRRASSFSCGFECEYEYEEFPIFDPEPWGFYASPFTTGARSTGVQRETYDAYGNYAGLDSITISQSGYMPVVSGDSSTLTLVSTNNDYTIRSDTGSPGSSTITYHLSQVMGQQSEDGSFCEYPDYGSDDTEEETTSCPSPDGDTSQYKQQVLTGGSSPTAGDFLQTLTTTGDDDGGSVTEAENATGNDGCHVSTSPYDPADTVNTPGQDHGAIWSVGGITPGFSESQVVPAGHNQWGPDEIGFVPGAVRWYQQHRPQLGLSSTCSTHVYQQLTFQCPQSSQDANALLGPYKINNELTSTIDSTGITNCRGGVCAPHYNYQ